jgi:hypothetical protein
MSAPDDQSDDLFPRRLKRWEALLLAATFAAALIGSHFHPWGFAPGA